MVNSDLPPDTYFLSDLTKLKEELSCHSINKLLYNSLYAFFLTFIVTGNSQINCPNKDNQLSKRVINVFTEKSLIYTGPNLPARSIFLLRKSVLGKWEKHTGRGHALLFA